MEIVQELLPGLYVLKSNRFTDGRGYLEVPYHSLEFEGLTDFRFNVDQTIYALSRRHVVRGLHYQSGAAPVAKLVACTLGVIYDVAVDLRSDSEAFGAWVCFELSQADDYLLYLPAGFAHGYLSLSNHSGVFYYQDGFYDPDESRVLAWNDPNLKIRWPLAGNEPVLSERDKQGMSWAEYKKNPEF